VLLFEPTLERAVLDAPEFKDGVAVRPLDEEGVSEATDCALGTCDREDEGVEAPAISL
jgi:hypothetical protein